MVPQFELFRDVPKKPCSAIFSKLERWKILVVRPDESIVKYLQIQLLRVFLTSQVQGKFRTQNSQRKLRQTPRAGDVGRQFARAQESFKND